jgi:ribose/xylose/arabinose/galactoside ABC-type transport system permease subunit
MELARLRRPTVGTPRRGRLETPAQAAIIGLVALIGVAIVVFLATTNGFATWVNIRAILTAASFVGMIAVGQALVMISGNFFSMSLGVQVAGSAILFFWSMKFGVVPAIVITLVVSALVSAAQGALVGLWSASSLIITIAASVLMSGIIVLATGGANVFPPGSGGSIAFLYGKVGGVSVAVFVMVGLALIGEVLMRRSTLGNAAYLVGASRPAARAAGLPVVPAITAVFAGAGICAAVAGIMLGSFQQAASLSLQGTLVFDAIAAVLVGGCSVLGGRGSVLASVFGAIFISALNSALVLNEYSKGVQLLVKGGLVLFVVVAVHIWRAEGSR